MTGAPGVTSIATGAILPHAPLLVEDIAGADLERELAPIRMAARAIDLAATDAIVVLSAHGRVDGVYARNRADFQLYGVPDHEITWRTDATVAEELAAAWDVEVIEDPVDHGVAVPIALSAPRVPVVAACLEESSGADDERALRFARALLQIGAGRTVAFVASVNTSAGLSPRAPLTELPGARMLEEDLRRTLETDAGALNGLVHALASTGGSCSAGPLSAFGTLFAAREVSVLAHAWPVGVGYMVATVPN